MLVRPSERSRLGAIFEYPVNRYASRFDTFRRIRVRPVPAALAYYKRSASLACMLMPNVQQTLQDMPCQPQDS